MRYNGIHVFMGKRKQECTGGNVKIVERTKVGQTRYMITLRIIQDKALLRTELMGTRRALAEDINVTEY